MVDWINLIISKVSKPIFTAIRTVMKVEVSFMILLNDFFSIYKKSLAINVDNDEISELGFDILTINVLLMYIIIYEIRFM